MKIAFVGEKLMLTDIEKEMSTVIVEGALLTVNGQLYEATVMSGDTAELIPVDRVDTLIAATHMAMRQKLEMLEMDRNIYEPEIKKQPVKFYDHFYKPNKNRRR